MDHYNALPLRHFAGNIAYCMDIELPRRFERPVKWAMDILTHHLSFMAERAVLYHADAVPMYLWQKEPALFAPVYAYTQMALPMRSTVESVTPVAHASMYTGVEPEVHGILSYTRPKLECETLYDVLLAQDKKIAIVAGTDSSFLHLFAGRELDYFEEPNAIAIKETALRLIAENKYDLVSVHTFDYDSAAHAFGPESKQALNAVSIEAECFDEIVKTVKLRCADRNTLLCYAPDHGQHLVEGGRGSHGSKMIEDMNILHFYGMVRANTDCREA